jgi:hypothetical protein
MIEDINFYVIDEKNDKHGWPRFRWRSLYNSAKGAWVNDMEDAIEHGEKHETIIREMLKIMGGVNANE